MTSFLDGLERRRADCYAQAEALLTRVQAENRTNLTPAESKELRGYQETLRGLDEHIEDLRTDEARSSIPVKYANLRRGGGGREVRSAGRLAPLGFTDQEMRAAHAKLSRGEPATLETRDFTTGVPLIPPELFPIPTFPRHEARLMDRLRGYQLDAPSLEYVQVTSVSGAAAVVGEGQPKPELDMPATKVITTALKLACHVGISWENINDYDAFTTAVTNELLKRVVDAENQQLVYGTGGTTELSGMTTTPGILSMAATGTTASPPNNYDDVAGAIAALRTGPALAEPDLLLLHPNTWASIRTQKDLYGRYLATPDPTEETAETVWGVDVLQSTQFNAGEAVLLDSNLMGYVAVRESLVLRIGYAGVDFISNILRHLAEERLNLAVERPAAICHITGLPTAAPLGTSSTGKPAAPHEGSKLSAAKK
jgi:HK97 family phage major capsid protein